MKIDDDVVLNKSWHYDGISRWLHWVLAGLLIGMIALGLYMTSISDQPGAGKFFNIHKSFGLIVAFLVLLTIIWRISHKPAPLPKTMPSWQIKIARITHFLLYLCIIAMPLTGFLGASFSKYGVTFFGLQVPRWVNQNREIAERILGIHGLIAWVLVALIILHVLAAFKHLLIDKDTVFQRMWF